jgi:hypothetical protein
VVLGHMCNVNMCIMCCNLLCSMGSQKTSFIITCGVGMKFSVCYNTLKPYDSSDNTSQLYMYQINCDFLIHEACNKTFTIITCFLVYCLFVYNIIVP